MYLVYFFNFYLIFLTFTSDFLLVCIIFGGRQHVLVHVKEILTECIRNIPSCNHDV